MTSFELVAPHPRYRESFLAALAELPAEDAGQLVYAGPAEAARADFAGYVAELLRRETDPPAPLVPDTIRWAVRGDEFLGRICRRHRLDDWLAKFGGHIGFAVRPSARGRGLASAMLARTLGEIPAGGPDALLLTCDPDNAASRRVIARNGGTLQDEIEGPQGARARTQRHWIRPRALLVRHCSSSGQEAEAELTPEGRAQARRLAAALARHEFHTLRSSPYRRALDSVRPFADARGQAIEVDPALGMGDEAPAPATLIQDLLARPGNLLAATHGPVVGQVLDALGERRWGRIANPDVFSLGRTPEGGIRVERLERE